jgi:hypothetical protein
VQALIDELFGRGEERPTAAEIMETVFTRALSMAGCHSPRGRGPTAEEVASDVIELIVSGRAGNTFDAEKHSATAYLAGMVSNLKRAFDGKHRRRSEVSLDLGLHDGAARQNDPLDIASTKELIQLLRSVWPRLSDRRRNAIRVQLGDVFADDGCDPLEERKDHLEKHRGIRQLRELLGRMYVRDFSS